MNIWRINGFTLHLATRQIPGRDAEVLIQAIQDHWGDRINIGDSQWVWWQMSLLGRIISLCYSHDAKTTREFSELTQEESDE